MASWRYYLAFWSRRSTATVVPASSASQARNRASARHKAGYGSLVSVQQANAADSRLIRQGSWVRRRRNGTWSYPDSVDRCQGSTVESVRVLMNCCS